MRTEHEAGGTLEEGVLVAWLDGALDGAERDAVAAHVEACQACADRAAALEARSRRMTRALDGADGPAPGAAEWREVLETAQRGDRRTVPHAPFGLSASRWRKAAGWTLAFVAAGALATSPVRAWIGDRWDALRGGDEPTPAVSTTTVDAAGGASLSFALPGPEMDVLVQTAQVGGTFTVRFGDAAKASVRVLEGGTEHLTVGRPGLRIANASASTTSYEMLAPAGVARVVVAVGARPRVVAERSDSGQAVVVDLSNGRVRTPDLDDE